MEIWWRRAAISACRAVWVRNVEAKSVNSAMKTGLILTLDDLINWCNSRVFSPDEVFGNVTMCYIVVGGNLNSPLNLFISFAKALMEQGFRSDLFLAKDSSNLVNGVLGLESEGRDLDVELSSARADHLIRAPHHTHGGLERAPGRILERLA